MSSLSGGSVEGRNDYLPENVNQSFQPDPDVTTSSDVTPSDVTPMDVSHNDVMLTNKPLLEREDSRTPLVGDSVPLETMGGAGYKLTTAL